MKWVIGFILIIVGIVFLGDALAIWHASDFAEIWRFWPLLLILLGVAVLTRRWKYGSWLVLVILVLSLAFVFSSVIWNKPVSIPGNQESGLKISTISEQLNDGIKNANIQIDSGALDLNVKSSDNLLAEGTLKSNAYTLSSSRNDNGSTANLDIKTDRTDGFFWEGNSMKNQLDLNLSSRIPLMLIINSGASDLNLDLTNIDLSGLNIRSGASEVDVTLGNKVEQNANFAIDSGASEVTFNLPKDLGIVVSLSSPLSSKDLPDFDQIGSQSYRSKDYDKSQKQISVRINSAISSIKVVRN